MRTNVDCLCLSLFLTLWIASISRSQDSLSDLLEQTKAKPPAARTTAFKKLENYWSPFPYVQDAETGKSVKHEVRMLSGHELDSIANAIKTGLADKNAKVRLAAAEALTTAPRNSPACTDALQDVLNSHDSEVRIRGYSSHYISKAELPKIERVIESILQDVQKHKPDEPILFNSCFFAYGSRLKPYSKQLIEAVFHNRKPGECPTGILPSISLSDEAVDELLLHADKVREPIAEYAFKAMLEHPQRLHELQAKQPKLAEYFDTSFPDLIYRILCQENEQAKHMRAWLSEQDRLPPTMMALIGNKKFVNELEKLEPAASLHHKKYLEACKRACGMQPENPVQVSANQPITFRPLSATRGGDKSRNGPKEPFCGLGPCNRLVTGTIRNTAGKPPAKIKFTEQLVRYDEDYKPIPFTIPRQVKYDSKDGSFVFFQVVDVTYGSRMELGPYKTNEIRIRIEAEGCEPLEVEFFDEMPHVQVTLAIE